MAALTGTLIGLGIASAVSHVAAAKIQSNASNKAAQTQQRGTDQALQTMRDIYGQTSAMHAPYMRAGEQSVNMLGSLMLPNGAPGGYTPSGPAPGQNPWLMPPAQQPVWGVGPGTGNAVSRVPPPMGPGAGIGGPLGPGTRPPAPPSPWVQAMGRGM